MVPAHGVSNDGMNLNQYIRFYNDSQWTQPPLGISEICLPYQPFRKCEYKQKGRLSIHLPFTSSSELGLLLRHKVFEIFAVFKPTHPHHW
jgi:hypothetical protein